MSLMSSLYTGVSGLAVSQRGLNMVAHNLSNVETNGYTRQQAVFTDSFYRNVGTNAISYLQVGYGASSEAIRQVRDVFLDRSYRQELGRQKFYEAQHEAAMEVEDILGETEGVAFQNSMKELWVALQELCKTPEDIVARTSFIQTAVSFIERAEKIYDQIADYQLNLNRQILNYVDRINEIGDEIRELNSKIQKYEASGQERANDLRDARNVLLDELGGLAAISYKEGVNGVVTIVMEDFPFVTEDLVYHIDTRRVSEDNDMIEPYWPNYGEESMFRFDPLPSSTANTDLGALKGLMLVRGNIIGKYTDIPKEPQKEEFTDETGYFFEDDYREAHKEYEKELAEYNRVVESSAIVSVQSQFDQLIHGIVTTINDLLCPNKEVLTASGEKIWILDEENAPVGMDGNSTPGEALFSRKSMERYERTTATIEVDGIWQDVEVWKYNEEDPENNYSLFTLGEIRVNSNILKDPSLIPLSKRGSTGDYSMDVCEELLSAWQAPFATLTPNEYTAHHFNDYYKEMVGALGTRGERYKNISDSQEALVNSVNNQRLSQMAVSSDEELTNMIRFQQAYNAAARYINTVSQMLEDLVTTLGR